MPLKSMASDTWIDKDMLLKIFARFEADWKIIYKDWWVVIKNFIKYQNYENIKIRTWIDRELEKVPQWLIDDINIPYV